jgi:hypothetical protein
MAIIEHPPTGDSIGTIEFPAVENNTHESLSSAEAEDEAKTARVKARVAAVLQQQEEDFLSGSGQSNDILDLIPPRLRRLSRSKSNRTPPEESIAESERTKPNLRLLCREYISQGNLSDSGDYWNVPEANVKISLKTGALFPLQYSKNRNPFPGTNPLTLWIAIHYPDSLEYTPDGTCTWVCRSGRILKKALKELRAWNDKVERGEYSDPEDFRNTPEYRDESQQIVFYALRSAGKNIWEGRAKGLVDLVREEVSKSDDKVIARFKAHPEFSSYKRLFQQLDIWVGDNLNRNLDWFEITEREDRVGKYVFTITLFKGSED